MIFSGNKVGIGDMLLPVEYLANMSSVRPEIN